MCSGKEKGIYGELVRTFSRLKNPNICVRLVCFFSPRGVYARLNIKQCLICNMRFAILKCLTKCIAHKHK